MSYSTRSYSRGVGQTPRDAVVVAGAQFGALGLMAVFGLGLWFLMAPKRER